MEKAEAKAAVETTTMLKTTVITVRPNLQLEFPYLIFWRKKYLVALLTQNKPKAITNPEIKIPDRPTPILVEAKIPEAAIKIQEIKDLSEIPNTTTEAVEVKEELLQEVAEAELMTEIVIEISTETSGILIEKMMEMSGISTEIDRQDSKMEVMINLGNNALLANNTHSLQVNVEVVLVGLEAAKIELPAIEILANGLIQLTTSPNSNVPITTPRP